MRGDRFGKQHGKAQNGPGGPKCSCCASGRKARTKALRKEAKAICEELKHDDSKRDAH